MKSAARTRSGRQAGVVRLLWVNSLPQPGRTLVMGILNVTPDSFSDGGEHLQREAAVAHGLRLFAEGAAQIDVRGA